MKVTARHLTASQRNAIRYKISATEAGVARKYGISVALVREVRAGAQLAHPARLAAWARRIGATEIRTGADAVHVRVAGGGGGGASGSVRRTVVPASALAPVKGQALHVEGGPDLPQPED